MLAASLKLEFPRNHCNLVVNLIPLQTWIIFFVVCFHVHMEVMEVQPSLLEVDNPNKK